MESLTNNVIEKLSSYKIFNNLFPGIIFCAITGKITRINCWLPNYLNIKVKNLITLNEKVIAQVWIKSIQIMCYDFYNTLEN